MVIAALASVLPIAAFFVVDAAPAGASVSVVTVGSPSPATVTAAATGTTPVTYSVNITSTSFTNRDFKISNVTGMPTGATFSATKCQAMTSSTDSPPTSTFPLTVTTPNNLPGTYTLTVTASDYNTTNNSCGGTANSTGTRHRHPGDPGRQPDGDERESGFAPAGCDQPERHHHRYQLLLSGAVASFSGTGVTVNSTTFVSSTQLTANISLTGAATGLRNVTVTNAGPTSTGR